MCGCFAFIARNGRKMDLGVIQDIAEVTMSRGQHAFGFAWIDGRNRLKMYKQSGRIVDHLGILGIARDAKMLIGHCRYATHGHYWDNMNNHPHASDGGWIVHNGKVLNYREIVRKYRLSPVTDCDSEAIGMLIELGRGRLTERCRAAVMATALSPLVIMGLWNRPRRLVVVRRGHPLSLGHAWEGDYLASLPEGLPGNVCEFEDETSMEFAPGRMVHQSLFTPAE
jgi:glucosamine 6-phosphate synthetase-like amidotransferase/phosphosugar isomerase protein